MTDLPAGVGVAIIGANGQRHPVTLAESAAPDPAGVGWTGVVEPEPGAPVAVRITLAPTASSGGTDRLVPSHPETDLSSRHLAVVDSLPRHPARSDEGAQSQDPGPIATGNCAPAAQNDAIYITVEALAVPVEINLQVEASVLATDPWWLIPGLFYGENRPADCDRLFPRFEINGDNPQGLVSDQWSFRSDRAATPLSCTWGDNDGVGLGVAELSELGPTGIGLAHQDDTATVHVIAPYREAPVTYYGSAEAKPPLRATHRLTPGVPVSLDVTLHRLGTDRHAYAPILRELWETTAARRQPAAWVNIAEAAELTAVGLLDWHYDPDPGVLLETIGFDRGIDVDGKPVDRQAMHIGWVSGIPWAYALLVHGLRAGNDAATAAATRVIDFCTEELAPSGTFWGAWYRDSGWTQSWTHIKRGLHARTLGEAAHFLARAIVAEGEAGREHPQWLAALRSNLDVLARRQRADGNLGAIHHAETGEVLQWRGAAGLAWIPAFVEAVEGGLSETLEQGELWLLAAVRAGEHYAQYVEREYIHGAPEDVDLAPTSEDGYAAVMAYLALHRLDGKRCWLDLARHAADWLLTFRYTYDVDFHPHTLLGAYRFSTRGSDQASPSNQHLANYGLICMREMLDLSRALDDPYYALRALETLDCHRQFIARRDGDFGAYRGMVSERYYQTECFQPKGMLLTLSHAWCVGVTLLGCEQALAHSGPLPQLH